MTEGDDSKNRLTTSAQGPHPFPFRTRQLSPAAPMVLQSRGCGRVGRRQPFLRKPHPAPLGGAFCIASQDRYKPSASEPHPSHLTYPQVQHPSLLIPCANFVSFGRFNVGSHTR